MAGMKTDHVDFSLHREIMSQLLHVSLECDGETISLQFLCDSRVCGEPLVYASPSEAARVGSEIFTSGILGQLPYDLGTEELRTLGKRLVQFANDCAASSGS
jgi:hypothetical protein